GTVHFTSTDGAATLPADYPFVLSDNGKKNISVTFKTASSETVTATDTVTSSVTGTSGAVAVGPGTATTLVFTTQPTDAVAGASISPAVNVAIEDAFGNTVASATSSVTVTFGNNAGTGTLSGTLAVNAVNGVSTFSNLSIDKTGTGYTL